MLISTSQCPKIDDNSVRPVVAPDLQSLLIVTSLVIVAIEMTTTELHGNMLHEIERSVADSLRLSQQTLIVTYPAKKTLLNPKFESTLFQIRSHSTIRLDSTGLRNGGEAIKQ
jgi:hypothetical protein